MNHSPNRPDFPHNPDLPPQRDPYAAPLTRKEAAMWRHWQANDFPDDQTRLTHEETTLLLNVFFKLDHAAGVTG